MRILVVEDDAALQNGLKLVVERAGHRATVAGDGVTADALLADEPFDLVVLDLGLPRMDGLTVLRRLRQRNQSMPVLILTARDGTADRVNGLDAGADDYLNKPFERSEFEARVRALLRRAQGTAVNFGGLKWSWETHQGWIDGQVLILTKAEVALLEALLQAPGRILTKSGLARRLASDDDSASDNTVEVYVYRLRRKLEPAGVQIKTVRGLGYLMQVAA
jgi:two-component system, OmpR family, response regulator